MKKFTVLMSVYAKDSPVYLLDSLKSIENQSLLPNQVVIIQDGIVPETIVNIINDFKKRTTFKVDVIKLTENRGLGYALSEGVLASENEIVIREDADDISIDNRFERLISYFQRNPDVEIVGELCS